MSAAPRAGSPAAPATPEARARAAWEDRHGSLAVERDRWFRVAAGSLALAALATGFGVWAAVRTEYVPYIVAIDELGAPAAALAPRQIRDWPDAAVRHELADFLRDWRSVSTDTDATMGRLRNVQYFVEEGSAADRKILAWARDPETSPLRVAENWTVDVEIVAVNFVGGRSWLAEWTETRRGRASGQADLRRRQQGTFVVGMRRVTDDRVLLENPLGLVVEDFDVVRVE